MVLLQAGTVAVIELGLLSDPGLITAGHLPTDARLALQFLVQIILLSVFVMARLSRQTTMTAVAQLETAVRQVAAREALLLEARQDLDRARQVGGAGRFTDQVVGSFLLGPLIGRGGMGEVYEARHIDTQEPAAVKLLSIEALENPDSVARFLREANHARALKVRTVVRVLEVGSTASRIPYLAMERLRGHDLSHYLRKRQRLPMAKVLRLIGDVGLGLEAARAAGIVHRDLKPNNLFLAEQPDGEPIWKILDFGVSKLVQSSGTLTRGSIVGTPGYMAPEQARSAEDVDHRADLYSLAVIAYRALTGHPAFSGRDVPSTLYDVVYKMPVKPSALVKVHEDVDRVLAIGMAKQPEDRFSSAAEFAGCLGAAAGGNLDQAVRARADRLLARLPWQDARRRSR